MINQGQKKFRPIVLLVVDGWGLSTAWGGNALAINSPTFLNALWRQYPNAILQIFSPDQLDRVKMGNSEVGHASLGGGRIVKDDFSDISALIDSGEFYKNAAIKKACALVNAKHSYLHLIWLLSHGAIHGYTGHLIALLEMAVRENVKNVVMHLITDGIDDVSDAGLEHVARLMGTIKKFGRGSVATLTGRHYAMNTEKDWHNIILAYRAQALGEAYTSETALHALAVSYDKGYTDENVPPVVIQGATEKSERRAILPMQADDVVIFGNFRGSGIRRLAKLYSDRQVFAQICGDKIQFIGAKILTLTDYQIGDKAEVIFPPVKLTETLAEIVSRNGLRQVHIGESEKSENITYFFNGGRSEKFAGEDDMIIPSPAVKSYDMTPEMSIEQVSRTAISTIKSGKYDFILVNFANLDALAHTGNFIATNKAVLKVDEAAKKVVETTLHHEGAVIVTADHGNAEQMIHRETLPDKMRHTSNPVPFIFVTPYNHRDLLHSAIKTPSTVLSNIMTSQHTIADVAPTILELLRLPIPKVMTGKSLLKIMN